LLIPWEKLSINSEESQELWKNIVEVSGADPLIFDEVMRGIMHPDPCIRKQAAEMIEKVTCVRPLFLTPYKRVLIHEMAEIQQVAVRQQLALLYGRVLWDEWDMKRAVMLLAQWIETEDDEDVKIHSLKSLYELSRQKEWIRPSEHASLPVRTFAQTLQV